MITDDAGAPCPVGEVSFQLGDTTYSSRFLWVHPTYPGFDTEGRFDVAIITLTTPVVGVTPSPLNRTIIPTVGMTLTIAGYGWRGTGETGESIAPPPDGMITWGTTPIETVTPTFIRWMYNSATPRESDTGSGDSGGPAFINDGLLTAVTTGGYPTGLGDGWGWGAPSFDTRVDVILDWIDSIIGGGTTPPPSPEPRPDLVVGAVGIIGTPVAGVPLQLSVSVANLGEKPASEFFVSVFLDRTTPANNSTGSVVTQLVQGGLQVNEIKTLTMTVTYPAPGTYTLAICADSESNVLESNELNNMFYQKINIFAVGSDLVLAAVAKIENPAGINAKFYATIVNRGMTAAGAFNVGFYANRFTAPTKSDAPDVSTPVAGLASGATTILIFDLPTQSAPHCGTAWFFADHNNVVAEDIETNNISSVTWGVANDAPVVSSDITASANPVTAGEAVTFTIAATDPNGDPISYAWDFGDGVTLVNGPNVSHTYATAGIYTVTVIISDGPFNKTIKTYLIEVTTDAVIDLGTVSLRNRRGRVALVVPMPTMFNKKDRPRTTLLSGNPGPKIKYRNYRLRGRALTKGEYKFIIEHQSRARAVMTNLKYKYAVVD
ncbi:MAG: CARDB domain-containing protein [Planctomycetota bacterium]